MEHYIICFLNDDDFDNYDLHSEHESLNFSVLSTQKAIGEGEPHILTFCPWAIDGRSAKGYNLYVMTSSGKRRVELLEYQNLGRMLEGGLSD